VEGNLTNLAPSDPRTNTTGSEPRTRTHIIDRVANWAAVLGTLAVVALLAAGGGIVGELATAGNLLWFVTLLVVVALAASALVFRFLISPIVGNQIRGLAEVAEWIAAGDLTHTPAAAAAGGSSGDSAARWSR
jgi:HAMP domain-containing protein